MIALAMVMSLQLQLAPPLERFVPAAADNRSASFTPREERRRSFNPLIGALELGVGLVGAYAGVLTGVAINFKLGGLVNPIDTADVMFLAVLPAAVGAVSSWLVGLLDLEQRSMIGSLLWAALGGVVGEIAGIAVGYVVGRSIAVSEDLSGAAAIAVFVAPAFAAFGAVLFMELFKPGALVASASLAPVRDERGRMSLVPAVAMRF